MTLSMVLLQWGRTREGAEGDDVLLKRQLTSSFSGAAPVKVRKGSRRSQLPARDDRASVGPHP